MTRDHGAQVSGPVFRPDTDRPDSFADYIAKLLEQNRDGEFVAIDRYGRRQSASFGELGEQAHAIGSKLHSAPLAEHTVAILCFEDILAFVASAWACLLAGIDFLPMETIDLRSNPQGFNDRLKALAARFRDPLVLSEIALVQSSRGNFPDSLQVVAIDGPDLDGSPVPAKRRQRESSLLVATSGTSGSAKLAVLDNRSLINRFFDGIGKDDRVCLYNLAHSSVAGVRLLLPIGRRVVYLHPLRLAASPTGWFRAVEEFGVTDVGMSSSIAAMLLGGLEKEALACDVASIKRVSFGAEMIVPAVARNLIAALDEFGMGEATVSLVYSMTETGPLFRSTLSKSQLMALPVGPEPVALNDCVPGWSLRCVDDDGRAIGDGDAGNIQVRSPAKLFAGYHGDGIHAGASARDRWFETGDLGRLDKGRLSLMGRARSTIIANARKITCEEIEAHLVSVAGPEAAAIIAAPYRTGATDGVAIFFVPALDEVAAEARLAKLIASTVSREFRLAASHVVPIRPEDIERTATMKVRRSALATKYREGNLRRADRGEVPDGQQRPGAEAKYLDLWRDALELAERPAMDDDLHELGGDSLAAARLICAVEARYGVQIAIDAFFEQPTPRRLQVLAGHASGPDIAAPGRLTRPAAPNPDLLRKIGGYVRTWSGLKASDDSFVVGFNTTGRARPLFWVFQGHAEAVALAQALGPDRPLYAMRSAVGLLPTLQYGETTLSGVLDRYFREILSISKGRPIDLGGNCQGGIVALLLARRLEQVGQGPALLYLLDWSFAHGAYNGRVKLLFGDVGGLLGDDEKSRRISRHRAQFPNSSVQWLHGRHGNYFKPSNVGRLAAILNPSSRPIVHRARVLAENCIRALPWLKRR